MAPKATYDELENRIKALKTERTRTEVVLRDNEVQYRSLIDKIQSAIVVHGSDTQILMCNPKAQEMLGLPQDQMIGRKAMDPKWQFIDANGVKMHTEQYPVNRVLATSQNALLNCNGHRKKNQTCWASAKPPSTASWTSINYSKSERIVMVDKEASKINQGKLN